MIRIKLKYVIIYVPIAVALITIFFSSLLNIYSNRNKIMEKIVGEHYGDAHHNEKRHLVNPLKKSERQIPPINLEDLKIKNDADIFGQWTAPIDWNVTAIHSILLPDETVMTFGTFGIDNKEQNKDLRENKKITITDGRLLDRDGGSHQWKMHDVNSGIDFDIWDYKKGIGENSHILFKKPVVMDAFCSIVRVLDEDRVFIVGGNKNMDTDQPDTQNATMIYNVKDKKFKLSKTLNYKRWYGSAVITGDNHMVILGGEDVVTQELSTTPEIIDLNNIDTGWKLLHKADSNDLFGNKDSAEWFYPRSFLASNGNIVGISYNKTWVMDKNNEYRVFKTGEIPLVKGVIAKTIEHENKNFKNSEKKHLRLLTMGSPVGETSSSVMIEKDVVYVFGGLQSAEHASSNQVYKIDFSDTFKPSIIELNSMNYPRNNGNATILPDGKIFLNGGTALSSDLEFSIFTPEIYDPNTQISNDMDKAYFRRNYHATSLLLPDGRILTAGGDVWNAEIFYPPYLFTKNFENKTVLAERPKILKIDKNIKRGRIVNIEVDGDISKVTLISTGSKTHAQGSQSKFRKLDFSKDNNKVKIKLDTNPNNLQNGTYMLFVLNSQGVPSEGKIIYIN